MMRRAPLIVLLAATACQAGSGAGDATGDLFIQNCTGLEDWGSLEMKKFFDLDPKFFAAEPIEDISPGQENNRLIIRLQRSGKRIELNDALVFDVVNTFDVARCVRGRVDADGKPDFDMDNCVWMGARPRVRVGIDRPIRANLIPRYTCRTAHPIRKEIWNVIGTATASADPLQDSWVEFESFGNAGQADVPAAERDAIGVGYKIDFGDRLHATSFQVTLQDDRVLTAIKDGDPAPAPDIAGQLIGSFDFDVVRGQGAQTFP